MTPKTLKATRRACGFTQQELATALGITREWICKLERGATIPKYLDHAVRAVAYYETGIWQDGEVD